MRLWSGNALLACRTVRSFRPSIRSISSTSTPNVPTAALVDSSQDSFESDTSNETEEPIETTRPRIEPYEPKAPYMISDLVLELDAADSKYVRTLESVEKDGWRPTIERREGKDVTMIQEKRAQKAQDDLNLFLRLHGVTPDKPYDNSSDPFLQPDSLGTRWETYEFLRDHVLRKYGSKRSTARRIERQDQVVIDHLLRIRKYWASKFKPYTATPSDLLRDALKGDPWRSQDDDSLDMRLMCEQEGVLKEDTPTTTIRVITSKFGSGWNRQRRFEEAGFTKRPSFEHYGFIYENLRAPTSLSHLKRMISILSSQKIGCEWLSTYREAAALRRGMDFLDLASEERLRLLNNLRLNMEGRGSFMGQILCNEAIRHALKVANYGAIQVYFRLLSQHNLSLTDLALDAFSKFVETTATSTPALEATHRNATLELCTGWEVNGVPDQEENRKPCFASFVHTDDVRPRYLHLLGELGAFEALDYEWQEMMRRSDVAYYHATPSAEALLLSQRPDLALNVLKLRESLKQRAEERIEEFSGGPTSLNEERLSVFRAACKLHAINHSTAQTNIVLAEKAINSTRDPRVVLGTMQDALSQWSYSLPPSRYPSYEQRDGWTRLVSK